MIQAMLFSLVLLTQDPVTGGVRATIADEGLTYEDCTQALTVARVNWPQQVVVCEVEAAVSRVQTVAPTVAEEVPGTNAAWELLWTVLAGAGLAVVAVYVSRPPRRRWRTRR